MITSVLMVALVAIVVVSHVSKALEVKRLADERRRESMRRVNERRHFREWEKDLNSSDTH